MALVNSAFTVNVTPGAMPPVVHVSEYDVGRTYTVTINGENGSAFNIPTGTTATIEGTLNGSVGFTQSATISNNQVSFALSESMTAYSGKAWCKIKLTLNDEPIQTCAFVLAVDRAGVEAETVIGADGFEQQIVNAVNDWLDEHPPASGGMTEAFKQALLDCFENVAWINDDGQTYYDALYAALYPPKTLVSISAVFNQGSAVIYDTDDLDTLKQYLTVTATYDDSSTGAVTNYTLSGTLTVGTSTITVSYGGKTATFNVTVSHVYETVYALHQSAGSTGKLTLPESFKTIELTMDMPTPATSVKALLGVSGTRPWFGTQNSQWKYEGDALEFTASKTFSEAVNQGKQTVVFDFASAALRAIGYDLGNYSPEVTWYRVRTFDGDTVTHDLKPTATVGDMYDSITGTTFSFSNTTNMEVIEVTT